MRNGKKGLKLLRCEVFLRHLFYCARSFRNQVTIYAAKQTVIIAVMYSTSRLFFFNNRSNPAIITLHCQLCTFISPPLWRDGGGCHKPLASCLLHQFESIFSFWTLASDICCENLSILKSWDWWKWAKQCQTRVYLKSSSNRQHLQCSTISAF